MKTRRTKRSQAISQILVVGAIFVMLTVQATHSATDVDITSPSAGATVSRFVPIVVSISGAASVVKFYVDGVYKASSPPSIWDMDSTRLSNGAHTISVLGLNGGGQQVDTDAISVHVQNGSGTPTPSSTPTSTPTPTPVASSFSNVFLVVEENHSYSSIVGNSLMPYLNALVHSSSLATNYYANAHPSLPDYLWLTVGGNDGISNDACESSTGPLNVDNVVRELNAAGRAWKAYEEDLPSAGHMGCSYAEYAQRHDPITYLSDVVNSAAQRERVVPFTQFRTDLHNNALPEYSFIAPNLCDDMHSDSTCSNGCTQASNSACWTAADNWLQANIGPLLTTSIFQPGGSGLLIIVFDESNGADTTNGGGHVAMVIVSPKAKVGYRSATFFQHQSTLRLTLEALGITRLPGAALNAPDMSEFFQQF